MQRRLVNASRLWYDSFRCRRTQQLKAVTHALASIWRVRPSAVVTAFFVCDCIRQGALADGLYGLNPRNTFWSLRPNVRARQHCLYRQNPRKTVPRFTPCVRPACLLGTG